MTIGSQVSNEKIILVVYFEYFLLFQFEKAYNIEENQLLKCSHHLTKGYGLDGLVSSAHL